MVAVRFARSFRFLLLAALVLQLLAAPCGATPEAATADDGVRPDAAMLQFPDVGRDKIVFLYANDLWLVDKKGGEATPLASPPGRESFPRFSPDGKRIAFTGNYDGNRDLYTLPVTGGVPFRVTHHPAGEILCDWTSCGRLIFYAYGMASHGRLSNLYTVSASGGLPQALPIPYGAVGAISPDGQWLAYTPYTRDSRSWKRYRGGMATDIWLFNLKTLKSRKITDWEGTDTLPMWHDGDIYYLSDQGPHHKLNIWRYDVQSGRRNQVTRFDTFDVKWPSIGPGDAGEGEIVFQCGKSLYLLDLGGQGLSKVSVTIPGALPSLGVQRLDASERIGAWDISATGKRAVVEARGDIWTLPAEKGSPRNLTRTNGTAERDPAWSPDGRWIAYFSDATGEYELCITQSDGKGETKQLTKESKIFYYNPVWSPDSKKIAFSDKAAKIYLHDIDAGTTKIVDDDDFPRYGVGVSWSHDSKWLAYTRQAKGREGPAIFVYSVDKDEAQQLTSGYFPDGGAVFDREGKYLYYVSNRSLTPEPSDFDYNAVAYTKTGVLMALALAADTKYPWLEESDEETWEKDKDEDAKEGAKEGEGDKAEDEGGGEDEKDAAEEDNDSGDDEEGEGEDEDEDEEGDEKPAKPDDGISGTWEGTAQTPEGELAFTLTFELSGSTVTGTFSSAMGSGEITGSFDKASSTLNLTLIIEGSMTVVLELTVENGTFSGTGTADGEDVPVTGTRISGPGDDEDDANGKDQKAKGKKKKLEPVKIDFEGVERRTIQLPVPPGNFGSLVVNDKNQLIYHRAGKGIKLFDISDEKKEEKTITAAGGGFVISGDGKKLLKFGSGASILKASAGGKSKKVPTRGMTAYVDPRQEWRQVFTDAWRFFRDYFYVANMHGLDWEAQRDRYGAMLADCASREDVSYLIRELIAELNVGHAYYFPSPEENEQPRVPVGLLGVDFELHEGAYRIAKIYEGGPWDSDARNPLKEPGVDVKEGEYLLAVNRVALDTTVDPWIAFIGLAGRTVSLTVSAKPNLDDEAREVVIKTLSRDSNLRYRAWIERNRAYVEEKTGGQVGYVYVPDTAWDGRNDFVRQYLGQVRKQALIIDERWNSGGFGPSFFIDIMFQPVTNYWALRDARDSIVPDTAHHGPKCMLINGLAGSGGDAFPWHFRRAGVGKLIGTRTWGGLVGFNGYPPSLIDGGRLGVPNVAFFEIDNTWCVEGHGVDPDIEVIDDPALMVDGGDPQLDKAIELMLEEIETYSYPKPIQPTAPDRSGMGIREEDK